MINIIIPNRGKEFMLEPPSQRVAGRFTIELVHKRTGLVAQRCEFDNLITNAGLNWFFRRGATPEDMSSGTGVGSSLLIPDNMMAYCAVGKGNAAPSVADTAMGLEVARTNSNGGISDTKGTAAGNAYIWYRKTYNFTTAQANDNLTEVGIWTSSSGGAMWSRQLIRDALGNPTTITKTPEFELRVVYEIRWYLDLTDKVSSCTVDGVAQNITTRISSLGNWTSASRPVIGVFGSLPRYFYMQAYSGGLGSVSSTPTGNLGAMTYLGGGVKIAPYVEGSFKWEFSGSFPAAQGNGLIRSINIEHASDGAPSYQGEFSNPFTKLNTQRLDANWSFSLARYEIP